MQKSVTREKTVTCFPFLSVLRQLHCAYHLFPTWRFSEGFIFIVRPKHGKTTVYYAFLIKISKQEMSNWVLVHTCLGHLLTPWFGCTDWIDTMFLAALLNQWARPHWRIFCSIYGLTNLLDTITVKHFSFNQSFTLYLFSPSSTSRVWSKNTCSSCDNTRRSSSVLSASCK